MAMRSAARLARELRDVVQSTRATDSHDHDRIYLFPVDTDDLTVRMRRYGCGRRAA